METYEVGEVIACRTPALDPFSRNSETVKGLSGTLEAFAPGKDPENSVVDRGAPDQSVNFAYQEDIGYVAFMPTTGFAAGTWTLRLHLFDSEGDGFGNVAYEQVEIRE